jgi:hypothetical protein
VFQIIPSIGFEWDAQCRPVAENGKIVFDGYRVKTYDDDTKRKKDELFNRYGTI